MRLDGRRALLTGATGGLGRAIAGALAFRGATVVLSSRKPDELEALAGELPGEGHGSVPCDLAQPGAVGELIERAGEIDVLVANAALPASGRLDEFAPDELERALRVNLEAPAQAARALVPAMARRGSGHLVFISSISGKAASPRASLYNATKFGLRGFALGLREELRGEGIGVSVVLPGFVGEAGMFADSGAKPPPGVGTATPEQVGAGVVRAVERDRAEVMVAPPQQRLLAAFAHHFPRAAALAARPMASKVAEQIARGQSGKR